MHTYLLVLLASDSARNRKLLPRLQLCFCGLARHPDTLANILITQFVEDAIAAQNDKIVILCNLKLANLRLCFHYVRVAASELQLGIWIAKSATDGETTR